MIFVALIVILLVLIFYWHLSMSHKSVGYRQSSYQKPKTLINQQATIHAHQPTTNTIQLPTTSPILQTKDIDETPTKRIPPSELASFQLINKQEVNQELVQQILKITQTIPRPHPMARSLLEGTEDSAKLLDLVKSDPEIAAKILTTVNSSQFYLSQKITRLNHAVVYLGTNMIKNIALQCLMKTVAHSKNKQLNTAFQKIWADAFLASTLASIFAKNLGLENAAELATQVVIAYIGNLAILSFKPELARSFGKNISLFHRVTIEQQELGVNAALVGTYLATEWKLPNEIVDGIRDSLIPLAIEPDQCELTGNNLRNVVFCYTCCRAAELIQEKELSDVSELNLEDEGLLELFYLPEYLAMTGLSQLYSLLKNPMLCKEVNKFIPNRSS